MTDGVRSAAERGGGMRALSGTAGVAWSGGTIPVDPAEGAETQGIEFDHSPTGHDGMFVAGNQGPEEPRLAPAKAAEGHHAVESRALLGPAPAGEPHEDPMPCALTENETPARARAAEPLLAAGAAGGQATVAASQSPMPLSAEAPESGAARPEAGPGQPGRAAQPGSSQHGPEQVPARLKRGLASAGGGRTGPDANGKDPVPASLASADRSRATIRNAEGAGEPPLRIERAAGASPASESSGHPEPAPGNGMDAARQASGGSWAAGPASPPTLPGAALTAGGERSGPVAAAGEVPEPLPEPGPRRLVLRVEGEEGQRVDIRLFQSPGSLRVRLSSLQAGLADGLRAEIHQLERSLETAGWRAQVGVAAEADPAVAMGLESSSRDFAGDSGAGRDSMAAMEPHSEGGGAREGRSQKGADLEEEFLDLSAIRRLYKGGRRER